MTILKHDNIVFGTITNTKKPKSMDQFNSSSSISRTYSNPLQFLNYLHDNQIKQEDIVIHYHGLNSEFTK